jgi:leucyl/phenylalanyl-tRNA--protein transferase
VGGDLSVDRLILAYENGIFPWYNSDQPILWWSPPKRMLLYPNRFKCSKSLRRSMIKSGFELRMDTAFEETIDACATMKRKGQDGTWISSEMKDAFMELHSIGFAHSIEIWQAEKLVGGLYGLSLGKAFFGESMFSQTADASKAAIFHLHDFMLQQHFHFIDCQLHTDHLESLGAIEIDRDTFLEELKAALAYPDLKGKWIADDI